MPNQQQSKQTKQPAKNNPSQESAGYNQKNTGSHNQALVFDAKDYVWGRLATKVAQLLMDKNQASFRPYHEGKNIIQVKNIRNIKITGKKLDSKIYYHHSGYPGGLKAIPFAKLFQENPAKVFRSTVYGMLPKNKLRDRRIKRLKFI